MVRIDDITKDWKEAGSFPAQINLYGFWDEHCFLTKSGDLGAFLKIGGIDYEGLHYAGRDYAVKRLESALRSLDDKCRLYQILFKRNRPAIPHAEYVNPLVRAAVQQRSAFLESKADQLYSIEIFWVVMIDGSYQKTGLLHALLQLPKQTRASLRALRALFSGSKSRTLLYEQIERDRIRLQQKVQSLSGQLNDLMTVELPGAEETFRILHRLVNLRPSKFQHARLHGARHLDWQLSDSELEAHRGYLRLDDDYVRVLTLKDFPRRRGLCCCRVCSISPPTFTSSPSGARLTTPRPGKRSLRDAATTTTRRHRLFPIFRIGRTPARTKLPSSEIATTKA